MVHQGLKEKGENVEKKKLLQHPTLTDFQPEKQLRKEEEVLKTHSRKEETAREYSFPQARRKRKTSIKRTLAAKHLKPEKNIVLFSVPTDQPTIQVV